MPERHVVSCEPCKRKKCKCDRKLPCCTQCTALPAFCRYHENNKRGIPTGYLNALEQRLNEMEDALYNALAELRELRPPSDHDEQPREVVSISSRPANASKGSRMAEWMRFPLKEPMDVKRWWEGVVDEHGKMQNSSSVIRSSGITDTSQYPNLRNDSSSGFRLASNSLPQARDQTVRSLGLGNEQLETSNSDSLAWAEDNVDVFGSVPQRLGNGRPGTREGPTASIMIQNSPLPTGERLAKSVQLTREMNHVYY